jgi:hypothetical protein
LETLLETLAGTKWETEGRNEVEVARQTEFKYLTGENHPYSLNYGYGISIVAKN